LLGLTIAGFLPGREDRIFASAMKKIANLIDLELLAASFAASLYW
jgi:hypothetical protein